MDCQTHALHAWDNESPHTGTTIVAVSFDGGVVLGADSRVSTGNYVSNRASDKITSLSDNAYMLRSGSAADTQAIADYGEYARKWHDSYHLLKKPFIRIVCINASFPMVPHFQREYCSYILI